MGLRGLHSWLCRGSVVRSVAPPGLRVSIGSRSQDFMGYYRFLPPGGRWQAGGMGMTWLVRGECVEVQKQVLRLR
jgi:hypothetical protein